MIDVYVRQIDEAEGHLLGSFQPHQLRDLPGLFQQFTTLDTQGVDCRLLEARFVLDGGAFFEILVDNPEAD